MAGWVRRGSLRGPAGPRGESVVSVAAETPQSAEDGDVALLTGEAGVVTGVAIWRDEATIPGEGTVPGSATFPRQEGWNVAECGDGQ